MKLLIQIISILTISIFLFIGICSIKFSMKRVTDYSMSPTLRVNDLALFEKGNHDLKRFDIVLIKQQSAYSIRRIIGLPGENVRYREDILWVDGKEYSESFIANEIAENQLYGGLFTKDFSLYAISNQSKIPDDQYLVLCDNRFFENDSRTYGLIDKYSIKAVLKLDVNLFK